MGEAKTKAEQDVKIAKAIAKSEHERLKAERETGTITKKEENQGNENNIKPDEYDIHGFKNKSWADVVKCKGKDAELPNIEGKHILDTMNTEEYTTSKDIHVTENTNINIPKEIMSLGTKDKDE